MDGTSHDDSARNGYDENKSSGGDDTTSKRTRSANRRRRTSATITKVRVARIETVAMTAEEETEAIQALAVLVARYWREHPRQAA